MTFSVPNSFAPDTTAKAAPVNENFDAVEAAINELTSAVIPVGTVLPTARPSAPTGYLLCEGQAVSRTKYATLYGAIGTSFGSGDGSTTFNLPDLRGRVPAGVDGGANRVTSNNALGKSGGNEKMQSHSHGAGGLGLGNDFPNHSHNLGWFGQTRHEGNLNAYEAVCVGGNTPTSGVTANHTHVISGNTANSGAGNSENLAPYQVLNYMIKA